MIENISRRDFMKKSAALTAAVGTASQLNAETSAPSLNARGLPVVKLGKTGVYVPRYALGTGSRFCQVPDEEKGLEILSYALDNGMYYWDTAAIYQSGDVISEVRLGKILKHRRKEVFLATKVGEREPDKAKAQIERSLERLQTQHLDLLQIHNLQSMEDVDIISKTGGVYDVVRQLKEQGVTKHIGFTGHTSAAAMKALAERLEFDTMLIALNHHQNGQQPFEQESVPYAYNKGMGVMVMKVIRPRETVKTLDPKNLVRYALSLENVHVVIIGIDNIQVLKTNLEILKTFKPYDEQQMQKIRTSLQPFYQNDQLEWMDPHYQDGVNT